MFNVLKCVACGTSLARGLRGHDHFSSSLSSNKNKNEWFSSGIGLVFPACIKKYGVGNSVFHSITATVFKS